MCTTFLTYKLVEILLRKSMTRLIDYPNLIRLNPNIPWKTRGNASLVLRLETELSRQTLFRICKSVIHRYATSERANAGLAIFEGAEVPDRVVEFSKGAMFTVQSLTEARSIMEKEGLSYYGLRAKQGLVGALAGIGNELKSDYTFELIAYRKNCSVRRTLDKSRIIGMDRDTRPLTFNCYDEENDRVLIMPHGPDPVLLGIRGETPRAVKEAFQMLLPLNNLLGYMIFRSNQGTGEHLQNELDLSSPKAYTSGKVNGIVSSLPRVEKGGHVYFNLRNEQGEIPCAAYEPTGKFRMNVLSLYLGDEIEVAGGIRKNTPKHPKILNLEYVIPLKLVSHWKEQNPKCPQCMGTMSSEGRNQGFQCKECGFKSKSVSKLKTRVERQLTEDRLYLPDLKAHRHLTKPLQRYIYEKSNSGNSAIARRGEFLENWILTS